MICFSCRTEIPETASFAYADTSGFPMCPRCFQRFLEARVDGEHFETWRQRSSDNFGFDPYLEHDAEIQMEAPRAAGLIGFSEDLLDMLEEARERTGLESQDILRTGLGMVLSNIQETESELLKMKTLAAYVAQAVTQAIRDAE